MISIFISYSFNDSFTRNIVDAISDLCTSNMDGAFNCVTLEDSQDIKWNLLESISKCSYFICILERFNPNIMFELGVALGANKKVIIIGEFVDIPYDLKDIPFIPKSKSVNEILAELSKYLYSGDIQKNKIICYENYKENLQQAMKNEDFINSISSREFEKIVYEYLKAQNLNVECSPRHMDAGYDFQILDKDCLVEVKKYNSSGKISLSVIRSLLGTMVEMGINKGIIISSSLFTKSAINYVNALKQKIVLLTIQDLLNLDGNFDSIFR